jgi:hypothetical protein
MKGMVPGQDEGIMALHGLGQELWRESDAQEYVNALREGRGFPGESRYT